MLLAFLIFAICALFIIYTSANLALLPILEKFPIFQNIRTMSNVMPREGPSIMTMLLAGACHRNAGRSGRARFLLRLDWWLVIIKDGKQANGPVQWQRVHFWRERKNRTTEDRTVRVHVYQRWRGCHSRRSSGGDDRSKA